jgi:hypothetical protein
MAISNQDRTDDVKEKNERLMDCRKPTFFRDCWNCSCRGHTSWLHIGFTLRVLFTGSLYGFILRVLYSVPLLGQLIRNYCTHILSKYMGPVALQVDH